MPNQLKFISNLIYNIKKNYGVPVDLYVETLESTNLETGIRVISRIKYPIKKVGIVPIKFIQGGFYSRSYLKATHDFTLGGYQDIEIKDFIIDGKDLPKGFELLSNHYFIRDHKKYEIANIMRIEEGLAYICTVKRLLGSQPNEIHSGQFGQTIRFTQSVTVVKE